MLYIEVLLPLPISNTFTYSLPESLLDYIDVGYRITVPFGKSKIITGIVFDVHRNKPDYDTKEIEQILDETPVVNAEQIKHWSWIANYYMCSLGEVLRIAMPSAFLLESETLVSLNPDFDGEISDLSDDEYLIFEALQRQSSIKAKEINKIIAKKSSLKQLQSLLQKQIIQLEEEVFEQYIPKKVTYVRLHEQYATRETLEPLLDELSSAPKQKEVLMRLFMLQAQMQSKPIFPKLLLEKADASAGVLNALIKKSIIERYELQEDRNQFEGEVEEIYTLTPAQNQALTEIKTGFETKDVCLLHGVTSSGKTQLYIQLIEDILPTGKQVLFLVPEIALTMQLISRLEKHFGDKLSVMHSKYSVHERIEVWNNVIEKQAKAQIIIGTRMALFLPFSDLGLIVIDEEHEASYKQINRAPRYHTRDAAVVLAHQHQAKVLLGSASPSFESYYNAKTGKYALVELTERYTNQYLPKIRFVNLQEAYERKQMKGRFSDELIQAIKHNLDLGQQVIIFQNRRGYSPIVECTTCGISPQCTNCDVSLTYHERTRQLRCHYCGYAIPMLVSCTACGNQTLDYKGFGTEQIEIETKRLFPDYRIARMDQDTTRRKHAYEKLIEKMTHRKIDILIGTQMVAKGLDFSHVGLVGVMQADSILNFPDFRAFERSFQLLQQVAGRAGRGKIHGDVIIQTFNPNHEVMGYLRNYDYSGMFLRDIKDRKEFHYPPYSRLIQITFRYRKYTEMRAAASWYANTLRSAFPDLVLGPEDPLIGRIRNQYITHVLFKIPNNFNLAKVKRQLKTIDNHFKSIPQFRVIDVIMDVDPA